MTSTVDRVEEWNPSQIPDPEPRDRRYLIVSVDDHVIEPEHMFRGRIPKKFEEPYVVHRDTDAEGWLFADKVLQTPAAMASFGRSRFDSRALIKFSDMRSSAYDIHARVRDMNADGVYASLCFPSFLGGFGGIRLESVSSDREYGLALMRAYNDWHIEEWAGTYPNRIIPCQLVWLFDPQVAADEVRRNAERGFKAITFPESPHEAGFPSLHSGYWDPLVQACAETDTVICVHTGSSGSLPETAKDAPQDVTTALFGAGYSLTTTVDWLYSRYTVRYPGLKIIISEGGVGWVPSLIDRLDHGYRKNGDHRGYWTETDLTPSEVLRRDFWFCLIDEPSVMPIRDRIGVEHICFETDFPHADTSWPDSQALLDTHMTGLPDEDVQRMTWKNAAELFRVEVPAEVQRDFNAF